MDVLVGPRYGETAADQLKEATRVTDIDPETLDRIQKLALDTGEAATLEDAAKIFSAYRLQVEVVADGLVGQAAEAAFATIVNAAPRAFQGGVRVRLAADPVLRHGWCKGMKASEVVARYGCTEAQEFAEVYPTLVLGSVESWPTDGLCLGIRHGGWAGGVVTDPTVHPPGSDDFAIAGVLAGAVAVAEAFQALRGNVRAGRRDHGMSLWAPERDWLDHDAQGPRSQGLLVPTKLSFLGLGHLGQGYLWTLGWLPYPNPSDVEVVLQDTDKVSRANLATSLLASEGVLGQYKTRALARTLEDHGFGTRIIERRFTEHQRIDDDPQIVLVGVDNPATRALLGGAGWKLIIDVGLGAGSGDYLDARLHAFPGTKTPEEIWGDKTGTFDEALLELPAYRAIERKTGDHCGTITIAGRAIGAAFVGAFAASLAVAELLRYYADSERRNDLVDLSLRDLTRPRSSTVAEWRGAENLGYARL
jgi:hypothetical protein